MRKLENRISIAPSVKTIAFFRLEQENDIQTTLRLTTSFIDKNWAYISMDAVESSQNGIPTVYNLIEE